MNFSEIEIEIENLLMEHDLESGEYQITVRINDEGDINASMSKEY